MNMRNGFTLIELLIVVAIIGLLSAIGYPLYTDYVTQGKITEATSGLSAGRIKMEQFFQDFRAYDNSTGGVVPTVAATADFGFVVASAPLTYTITATGTGGMTGFVYTIDETNTRTTVSTPSWGSNATCWVRKPGGVC
ncbi:MAG: prepilin-type N-terminal cleavage/methylation domain-containing protein [Sideroxyarcus sp.]|nr:prepilin-type N-terminal cleavage/methylation domain-containing protein [Sideroxyarcus sp.]